MTQRPKTSYKELRREFTKRYNFLDNQKASKIQTVEKMTEAYKITSGGGGIRRWTRTFLIHIQNYSQKFLNTSAKKAAEVFTRTGLLLIETKPAGGMGIWLYCWLHLDTWEKLRLSTRRNEVEKYLEHFDRESWRTAYIYFCCAVLS